VIFSVPAFSATQKGKYFDRVIFVVFENTSYKETIKQPFFAKLAKRGALFSNFTAHAHHSQPNYIALTSGSMHGVEENQNVNLNKKNIVDLLEARGISWKVYAEGYPGNCFTGGSRGGYARKHNPFISYVNIQKNPKRCKNIVNAVEFDKDGAAGALPEYVFYIPDNNNSGHDSGVAFADKWYQKKFSKYVSDEKFMKETVLVSTFDESSGGDKKNHIYTSIVGPEVKPGVYDKGLNLYSLLRLVQDNWGLGSLGRNDESAESIPDIWK
jgi:hypothetical protein